MASELELIAGLNTRLNTLPDSPPVAWENVKYSPDGENYLEQRYLAAEGFTVGVSQGGADVLAGIYQITVNTKKSRGLAESATLVEAIRAHFARSSTLTQGDTRIVIHKVWSGAALPDEVYYKVPVSVRVRGV